MGDVISFPGKGARDWLEMEREIAPALVKRGLSKGAQSYVLAEMKAFYELTKPGLEITIKDLAIPTDLNEANIATFKADLVRIVGDAVSESLGKFKVNILAERANHEIDIAEMLGL